MTGKPPFCQFPNDAAIISKLHNGVRPERPTAWEVMNRGLSDGLWQLIERCWFDVPAKRPSMSHVLRDLDSISSENG